MLKWQHPRRLQARVDAQVPGTDVQINQLVAHDHDVDSEVMQHRSMPRTLRSISNSSSTTPVMIRMILDDPLHLSIRSGLKAPVESGGSFPKRRKTSPSSLQHLQTLQNRKWLRRPRAGLGPCLSRALVPRISPTDAARTSR